MSQSDKSMGRDRGGEREQVLTPEFASARTALVRAVGKQERKRRLRQIYATRGAYGRDARQHMTLHFFAMTAACHREWNRSTLTLLGLPSSTATS